MEPNLESIVLYNQHGRKIDPILLDLCSSAIGHELNGYTLIRKHESKERTTLLIQRTPFDYGVLCFYGDRCYHWRNMEIVELFSAYAIAISDLSNEKFEPLLNSIIDSKNYIDYLELTPEQYEELTQSSEFTGISANDIQIKEVNKYYDVVIYKG